MLDELAVTNLGLIAGARLELGPGLTVISGETGAGKTLLLGALRLLIGAAAGSDQVGPDGPEAVVEGRFVGPDRELVAARRLVAGGRSRAYLDGHLAPNRQLTEEVGPFVELVGQHDHLTIGRPTEVRAMLDGALDATGRRARAAYAEVWDRLVAVRHDQQALGGDPRSLAREHELATHEADEIAAAGFEPGDEEQLRALVDRLRNAEELTAELDAAHRALADDGAAGDALGRAADALRRAARLDPTLSDVADDAAALTSGLAELAGDVARRAAALEAGTGDLDAVEERLALLGALKRKYGADLAAVLEYGKRAAAHASELAGVLERAAGIEGEVAEAVAAAAAAGEELASARREAGERLATAAVAELRDLGFERPVVSFTVEAAVPGPDGADRVGLEFASDESLPAGPVGRVASGGELSRLVLALRLAAGAGAAPVVAFDEVDAGVGGATALQLGRKLAGLAAERQVLCVTHLPQVAAFADRHLVVERTGKAAAVRLVDGEDRLAELSRMLSGLPASERGREHAGELLALAASG